MKVGEVLEKKIINFTIKQIGNEQDRMLEFIGSDESEDRDNDIIEVDGWKTDDYMKNPVFLWGHDYSIPPIGKCVSVKKDGFSKKLLFTIKFPTIDEISSDTDNISDHAKFTDMVYNMYKNGYLNATSVGFKGIEHKIRDDNKVLGMPEYQRGRRYIKQNLLELSAVPVPANANALQTAKTKGLISDNEIKSFFNKDILQKLFKNESEGCNFDEGRSVDMNIEELNKVKEEFNNMFSEFKSFIKNHMKFKNINDEGNDKETKSKTDLENNIGIFNIELKKLVEEVKSISEEIKKGMIEPKNQPNTVTDSYFSSDDMKSLLSEVIVEEMKSITGKI